MYLNHFENTMNFLNHYVLTSHKYVVRVVAFFQCLFLIELNAWEDDLLLYYNFYPKKGKKNEKRRRKRNDIIHGQYTNA